MILAIVVIGVLHTARIDLLVGKNHADRIQAHYLALAGIEKAKALIYQDARERTRIGQSHSGNVYSAPDQFRNARFGRGEFRVFRRGRDDEGGGVIYGVSDEESRLNVNAASIEELAKLEGMTRDVAAAIIDWRDADNTVTPGGAETDYYTSLQPPYLPRNAPFETVRELLMVRGMSRRLLFGNDVHQNGQLEAEAANVSRRDEPGLDTGWAGLLTVDSTTDNVSANGQERVNIQDADERALAALQGFTPEIAKAVVAFRGKNRFESIADLLDVTAAQPQNQGAAISNPNPDPNPPNAPNPQPSPNPDSSTPNQPQNNSSGPRVISQDLLMDIADDITVQSGDSLPGLVNINTASPETLLCLPGLNREIAHAIIQYRQSNGFFRNIAHLLKVGGMTRDTFKQVAPRVTARSETFRILSEGQVTSSGARERIQEIVHIGLHKLVTVSYREDDL